MKATLQIPDALYRELKIETAREGLTMREVTISLFEQWLRQKKTVSSDRADSRLAQLTRPARSILLQKTSPITVAPA